MVLAAPNELFHKITVFITFQESEKVCFNYTRHSKQITPRKARKKVVSLTTGNNDLLKSIAFVTLQESEKWLFGLDQMTQTSYNNKRPATGTRPRVETRRNIF